jgi:hypothetical protein
MTDAVDPVLFRNEGIAFHKEGRIHMPLVYWTMKRPVNSLAEALEERLLHQTDDRPAIRWANGSKEWFRFGLFHRDGDLPAYVGNDGSKGWGQNGQVHRDEGPACVRSNGVESWYQLGLLHRDDGPSITELDGTWSFYDHGRQHRDDDLPATFLFDYTDIEASSEEGVRVVVEWIAKDALNRPQSFGPACFEYWPETGAWAARYYYNDTLHNDFGPASIYVPSEGDPELRHYLHGERWIGLGDEELPSVLGLKGIPALKPVLPVRRRQQLLEEISAGVGSLDAGRGGGAALVTPLRPDHRIRTVSALLALISGEADEKANPDRQSALVP